MSVYSSKSREVVICGQRFVVSQANTMTAPYRAILIEQASERWKDIVDDDSAETKAKRYIETYLYPCVISVTKSLDEPLPTLDEFIDMPEGEQDKWLQIVNELNPHFFELEKSNQKKNRKRRK